MSEKEIQTVMAHEVGTIPAEWLAPETEAEPQPEPKYSPDDQGFKKAVMAVVLDMKRRKVI
ncbi:hypothetical protein LH464_05230 [Neorhizobium sp. T786]|uniref:hypothetical protein n=1 Tax=Pseudorhizobium xiangyangii TaxID=2883104 RepID=UPI001CFFE218|nr:hypothetical protein [Neorhizobium xiangyangii]MCB5201880.1 hypothetical protein [Neorhizobium xiangyangii]